MAIKTTTVVDATRVADMARAIFAAVSPIITADTDVKAAKGALDEASEARTQGRFGILLGLAQCSVAGGWTEGEISLAVAQATKLANNIESQKAIATFAADCKVAMHPTVRDHASRLRDMIGQAWSSEKDQPKELPKPIAKAFKREYHAYKSALVLTRENGGPVLAGTHDVVAWANENDPDFDPKKVVAQLEAMKAAIATIAGNFPLSHFASIVEFLGDVNEAGLKAARNGLLHSQEELTQAHTLAPIPDVVSQRVEAAKDTATTVVVDPVADYLDELESGMAA